MKSNSKSISKAVQLLALKSESAEIKASSHQSVQIFKEAQNSEQKREKTQENHLKQS